MTKIFTLLLILLTANLFSKNITLWHAYRAKERKALEKVVKKYEKAEKIKINLLAIPYDAFDKKLTASNTNVIPRGFTVVILLSSNTLTNLCGIVL